MFYFNSIVSKSSIANLQEKISAKKFIKFNSRYQRFRLKPIWAKAIFQFLSWPLPKSCTLGVTMRIVHCTLLNHFCRRLNMVTQANWSKSLRQMFWLVCWYRTLCFEKMGNTTLCTMMHQFLSRTRRKSMNWFPLLMLTNAMISTNSKKITVILISSHKAKDTRVSNPNFYSRWRRKNSLLWSTRISR